MRSIVGRLVLLLLPLILPSIGHAQKGLKKEAAAMIFKTTFHEILKRYLVGIGPAGQKAGPILTTSPRRKIASATLLMIMPRWQASII